MTARIPHELLAGRRVLVAEDDFMSKVLIEDMLGELAVDVVGTVSGADEILRTVDQHRPDAVTLDINLKGRAVYPAAAELRDRGIPVVFISGYGALVDCPEALSTVPRLEKPFRLAELATALEKALAQ